MYKISGKWSGTTIATSSAEPKKESIMFDGVRHPGHTKIVLDEIQQEEFESRR